MSISRPNAQQLAVYNSGLIVFLYDELNRDTINELGPNIIGGYGGDELSDPALQEAGQKGLLATYELQQDDELSIQVIVGAPLTSEEMEPLAYFSVQHSRLNLPSGRLAIESYDSIQLGDEDPTDEPGLVEVPAGEYIVSLYRISYEGLRKKGIEDYKGVGEVIVLTPTSEFVGEVTPLPFLRFPVEEYLNVAGELD